MNISHIRRVYVGKNKFAKIDKCQDSYDIYLVNVFIIKWIDNVVPTVGIVVVSESVLFVSPSIVERD